MARATVFVFSDGMMAYQHPLIHCTATAQIVLTAACCISIYTLSDATVFVFSDGMIAYQHWLLVARVVDRCLVFVSAFGRYCYEKTATPGLCARHFRGFSRVLDVYYS